MSKEIGVVSETNLQHRLLKITAEVAVRATGKTAQGQRTMSIADVEASLADLCAKHGVVMGDYSWNGEPKIVAQQGNSTLWQADLNLLTVNADNPADRIITRLLDVGTSPSAAVSFAIKRYYRALFHLADEEDEARSTPAVRRTAERARFTPRKPVSDSDDQGVVPSENTDRGVKASQGGSVAETDDGAARTNNGTILTDTQKVVLAALGRGLDPPWTVTQRKINEAGGYEPVYDFLLGQHRQQHGVCQCLGHAVMAAAESRP